MLAQTGFTSIVQVLMTISLHPFICLSCCPPTAQGRCTWFNPVQKAKDEFEDEEEEEEEKEQIEEPEPETGPPLLTAIDQDNRKQHLLPSSPPSLHPSSYSLCISP